MRVWPVSLIILAFSFLSSLDSILVRHAAVIGMAKCSVEQVVNMPSQVDLLALGSSRVLEGISTSTIEAASHGTIRRSFNLGRTDLSALRSYVILRDILERGIKPTIVFVEVNINALMDGGSQDQVKIPPHSAIMKFSDIGVLVESHKELGNVELHRLKVLAIFEKVRGSIIPILSGVPVLAWLRAGKQPISDCMDTYSEKQLRIGQEQLEKHRLAYLSTHRVGKPIETDYRPRATVSASWRQELFFLEKIRALCQARGIALVVSRHWRAYEPPLSDSALAEIKTLIPEFEYPPKDLIRHTWAYFRDVAHMGPKAREIYSEWLTSRLMRMERM